MVLRDFVQDSIRPQNLSDPILDKLWFVGKIFNKLPFDPELLDLPVHQLDWLLAKYADENPQTFKLIKAGEPEQESIPEGRKWAAQQKAWAKVLKGKALSKHENIDALRPVIEASARLKASKGIVSGVGVMKPTAREFGPDGKPKKAIE